MKRSRKLLLITATMLIAICSYIIFAKAADGLKYEQQAKLLYDLGLFKGRSNAEYQPDLESKLTRQEGLAMLIRLLGEEENALKMTDDEANKVLEKFSDKNTIDTWAKKYVSYSVKKGIVKGMPDGTLAPAQNLIGNEYCTMILRSLGHKVEGDDFNKAVDNFANKGGIKPEDAKGMANKELIRDDVAGLSVGVLNLTYENGRSVLVDLCIKKVITEEKMKKAGLSEDRIKKILKESADEEQKIKNADKKEEKVDVKEAVKVSDVKVSESGREVVVMFEKDVKDTKDYTFDLYEDDEKIDLDKPEWDEKKMVYLFKEDKPAFKKSIYKLVVNYKNEPVATEEFSVR